MAARRVGRGAKRGRGRSRVALLLVGFVLVAVGVIWRRTYGMAQSRELRELDRRRLDLVAQRTRLESDIRDLSSRARLAPIAEQRLKMHVPNDSQVVIIAVPRGDSGGRR
ncbi:MAG TPA: cell division protein FtsL [Gemmatimonadaceae bacterium]|nr:cell division protein FtsL [Gemmatimonadaceae bacterium]